MPLSTSEIIRIAAPVAIREFNRNYVLGEVRQPENRAVYAARLYDIDTGHHVEIAWSRAEEHMRPEAEKIRFVRQLLTNAIHWLDARNAGPNPPLVEWRENPALPFDNVIDVEVDDSVIDVDFS